MPNEFVIKNGYISKGNSIVEGGLTATTISATTYSNLPSSPITVGTTQITSGTDGRVLFQSGTTLQQDSNFTYDATLKRLTLIANGTASTNIPFDIQNSGGGSSVLRVRGDQAIEIIRENPSTNGGILITKTDTYNTPRIQMYNVFSQLIDINGGTQTITTSNIKCGNSGAAGFLGFVTPVSQDRYLKFINLFGQETLSIGGNNYDGIATFTMKSQARVGIGTNSPQSRLDVRAQGALSTDIAFRVRNNGDTADLMSIRGDGSYWIQSVPFMHAAYLTGTNNTAQGLFLGYNVASLSTTSTNAVIIGRGSGAILQGNGNTIIGDGFSHGTFSNSIGLGRGVVVNGSNQFVSGSQLYPTNTWLVSTGGEVTDGSYLRGLDFKVSGMAGGPSNISAATFPIRFFSPNGTGTGAGSNIQFHVAPSNTGGGAFFRNIFSEMFTIRGEADGLNHYQLSTPRVPSASITDGYVQYSNDITAGNAAPHFRTENGSIVKLYQNANTVAIDDVLVNIGLRASGGTSNFSNSISTTTISATTFNLNGSQLDTLWTSYTPTWTASSSNPSIGNGTIEGYYKLIGKTCFVRGNIAMGSTTTFGSGEWYVELPFPAKHADGILMTANLLDNGTAWFNAVLNGARAGFNTKAPIQYQGGAGTALDVNATQPFTWTSTDRFLWNGSYEIA